VENCEKRLQTAVAAQSRLAYTSTRRSRQKNQTIQVPSLQSGYEYISASYMTCEYVLSWQPPTPISKPKTHCCCLKARLLPSRQRVRWAFKSDLKRKGLAQCSQYCQSDRSSEWWTLLRAQKNQLCRDVMYVQLGFETLQIVLCWTLRQCNSPCGHLPVLTPLTKFSSNLPSPNALPSPEAILPYPKSTCLVQMQLPLFRNNPNPPVPEAMADSKLTCMVMKWFVWS
jgi:hypothetical protein